MKGQLSTGQQKVGDIENLRFKVQQLNKEKEEQSSTFEQLTEQLQAKLLETAKKESGLELRMATLRAMLEQEVKGHEKTKFYKEQLALSKHMKMDSVRRNVTSLKSSLNSIREQLNSDISSTRSEYEGMVTKFVSDVLLNQNNAQPHLYNMETEQQLKKSENDKNVAESRLNDVIQVLQDIGAINVVQEKLLLKEAMERSASKQPRLMPTNELLSPVSQDLSTLDDTFHTPLEYRKPKQEIFHTPMGVRGVTRYDPSVEWSGSEASYGSEPNPLEPQTPTIHRK